MYLCKLKISCTPKSYKLYVSIRFIYYLHFSRYIYNKHIVYINFKL